MSAARKLPARPEQMQMRLARIRDHFLKNSPMMRIPPIAASECQLVLEAYYGGAWHSIWALAKQAAWLGCVSLKSRLVIWICDRAGWTKVYQVPETATHIAHWQRHGRKCSGSPNCNNMRCIEDSVPRWFRKLAGWRDDNL